MISEWSAAQRQAAPSEIYLFAWALANIPPTEQPAALLHGDFTPHNCLFKDGRLSGVLDWECAEFGDPAADLAYLRPHIEARMNWDVFMERYEQVSGKKIADERIRFFANFFHLRTLVCCNIVATRVEQGRSTEIVALNIDYEYLPKMMQICVDATLN
jgi:aminoglycoside phosphotransferase (APT) family kinase protein